jgi:hypothetical protein
MKAYSCNICGCEIKLVKPDRCPLCRKKHDDYTEIEEQDPSPDDLVYTKMYEDALKILDKYTEKCEPEIAKYAFEE